MNEEMSANNQDNAAAARGTLWRRASIGLAAAVTITLAAACTSLAQPAPTAGHAPLPAGHATLASKSSKHGEPAHHSSGGSKASGHTHPGTPSGSSADHGGASGTSSGGSSGKSPGGTPVSTSGAVAACQTGNVTVTHTGGSGAMGTLIAEYAMKNTGTDSCSVEGYPYIDPYGPVGNTEQRLPVKVEALEGIANISGPGGLVVLKSGGTAVFFVKSTDVDQPGGCDTWDGFYFGTPASSSSSQVQVGLSGSGLLCGALLNVSAMFPPSTTLW